MGSIIFVPIFFIFSFIAYNLYQRFKYKLPPGPAPWPVVGNIYDVKPVRFRCFYEWAQTYGPIISFKLGPELNIVVSNAELAKQVLKEHDQNLADRYRRPLGKFTKDGKDLIWADYGPHYVKVRKVSTLALFTPKKVDALRPIREDEATAMIESLFNHCNDSENKGKPLNIRKHTAIMSFNNITRLTFGKRFINSKGELDPLGKELMEILTNRKAKANTHANFLAEHLPWFQQLMSIFDSNDKDETTMLNARLDQFIKEIIDEHAEAKLKNNVGGVTVNKQHFVDALLTLKDEYDLGEDTLFGLLWDMIIAGVDTVAISVEWGLAELIRNPRVQKKAQKELDQIIGNRIMTEDDFSNLPYLKALAKETLRLHPPTPLMLPHKAKAHVKISGYDIPKGATVRVNVWALGRDSNVWGNDVNEFRPERFFEEDVDMKGHDFRLLPFGAGRRICPGAQIGINLVTSMLGHLLHHFEWNPPNEVKVDDIDMTESPGIVTYMKIPLQANIIPRLPTDLYKRIPFDM